MIWHDDDEVPILLATYNSNRQSQPVRSGREGQYAHYNMHIYNTDFYKGMNVSGVWCSV